jgi:hypothetical protein
MSFVGGLESQTLTHSYNDTAENLTEVLVNAIESGELAARKATEERTDASSSLNSEVEFAKRFFDPFFEYRKQLHEKVWAHKDVRVFAKMGKLSLLYDRLKTIEDFMAVWGLLGLICMLLLDEEMYLAHAGDYDFEEDHFEKVFKMFLTFNSVTLVVALYFRYAFHIQMKILRHVYPAGTTVWNWHKERRMFLLEAILLGFHVPYGCDFFIDFSLISISVDEPNHMHVNYLNVLMFVRLYLIVRVMRNHAGFYGQHIHFIGAQQGVDTTDIVFNFRMLLKERPLQLLLPLYVVCTVATAITVCMNERIQEGASVTTYYEAIWMALITEATVGYGDYFPITTLGRVFAVVGGIIGGTIVQTLVVASFVEFTKSDNREATVVNLASKKFFAKGLRIAAAKVIQSTYWQWHYQKMNRRKGRKVYDVEGAQHVMFQDILDFQEHRFSQPDQSSSDHARLQATGRMIDEIISVVRGNVDLENIDDSITKIIVELHERQKRVDEMVADVHKMLTRQ